MTASLLRRAGLVQRPKVSTLNVAWVVWVIVLASCGGERAPARGEPIGRIAFESDRDGNKEIYVMNADGSELTNLTNDPLSDYLPNWSPDGTKLAFGSNREGPADIWVMNADGSGLTRLTSPGYEHLWPAWSPDGTKIAFNMHSGFDTEEPNVDYPSIYVMNADGSGRRRLTRQEDTGPAWSPDGTRLAFSRLEGRTSDIWVMNADGSQPTRLTNHPAADHSPAWSPDGTRLAFVRSEQEDSSDIWVMNADGSGVTRLTSHPAIDGAPAWSPDGTRLAFHSNRVGNYEIYVMNADGSGVTRLTHQPAADRFPSWSAVSQPPSAAARLPPESGAPAPVLESFDPRLARLDSLLAPELARLDSIRARMRRDSGTARADSAFETLRRSYPQRDPDWGADFERWLQSEAAYDSARRFFAARWLVLYSSGGWEGEPVEYRLASDLDSLFRAFGAYLTGPMRAYLETLTREVAASVDYEGSWEHDWDELEENIVLWERFLEDNPDLAVFDSLWSDAQGRYSRFLRDYVHGQQLVYSVSSSGELVSEARASYERLVAQHGNTHAARFVRGLLDAYRTSNYRDSPAVRAYLAQTPLPVPGRRAGR